MSHVGKTSEELAASPSAMVWRIERPGVRDWTVHKRSQQGDLLALLSEDGREIEVFELLMQVYQPPVPVDTFANLKMPIIIVGIVLVLAYQYIKQKRKFGGGSKLDTQESAAFRGKHKRQ